MKTILMGLLCWAVLAVSASATVQVVLDESFESSGPTANGWTVGDANVYGTPAYWDRVDSGLSGRVAHHGAWSAYSAGVGYTGSAGALRYQPSMEAYMERTVDLTGASGAAMSFWYWLPSGDVGFDCLTVSVGGDVLATISATTVGWTTQSFDLTPYCGQSLTLRFAWFSDAVMMGEGVYLDNILVIKTVQGLSPSGGEIVADRTPMLSWPATAGATWYQLWINRNGQTYSRPWVQSAVMWVPPQDLPAGSYRWWVQGWGPGIGLGAWSQPADFSILAQPPGAITQIDPQGAQGSNDLTYRWQRDANATWYHLWVGREGAGAWHDQWYNQMGTGEGTAWLTGHPGGNFTWWIQGWGPDGAGAWSGPMVFSTPSAAPARPTTLWPIGTLATRQPEFQWNPAARAQWYRLYVCRGSTTVADTWMQTTSWTPPTNLSLGAHSWWVASWNAVTGTQVWSDRTDFLLVP